MIRLVVVGVPIALRDFWRRIVIRPDVIPDAATPTEPIDITEMHPPVEIERVGTKPYARSV